ncbi:MAG: outer membrane beta-barrel protein [bacterium]
MVISSAGLGLADDLMISGFAETNVDITDEAKDKKCTSPTSPALTTNCDELQFIATAEVDFERKQGDVTVRVDLDFPALGQKNNIMVEIEQAKFDWAIPAGSEIGLNLTAGVFNSPIGFEAQDSPDKLQVSNGQLFGLAPSNLAGVQLAAGNNMVNGSILFANDWNNPTPKTAGTVGEENSFGATLAISPMPEAVLSVGYLDSGLSSIPVTAGTAATEALLDIILSGTLMPTPDVSLLYALEYLSDEVRDGSGITLHAMHGKHGLTIRYDMVETDGVAAEPTTLTVALSCKGISDNLKTNLEWKSTDPDTTVSSTDEIVLQFVMMF